MNGRNARLKGMRVEREMVERLNLAGIAAERVPLSGAAGGSYTGDIVILDRFRAEVKARAGGAGFQTLRGWLGENDVLLLKENREDGLVCLTWGTFVTLMRFVRDTDRRALGGGLTPEDDREPSS